jgi:hypothetical protein
VRDLAREEASIEARLAALPSDHPERPGLETALADTRARLQEARSRAAREQREAMGEGLALAEGLLGGLAPVAAALLPPLAGVLGLLARALGALGRRIRPAGGAP